MGTNNFLKYFIIYILFINLISFLSMYIDKQKAKKGKQRIREKTLLILIALGGWVGGPIGMKLFRHKTKKDKFVLGVPIIIIIEIICMIILIFIT